MIVLDKYKQYFGLIYKTIFPNGMIYIGYTRLIVGTEKYNNYFGSGNAEFKSTVRKFGRINITKEILHIIYVDDYRYIDNLNDKFLLKVLKCYEIKYQNKFHSCDPKIGYNIIKGDNFKKGMFGEIFITNGIITNRLRKGQPIPIGFVIGTSQSFKEKSRGFKSGEKKIWITDGIKSRQILVEEQIPIGWKRGMDDKNRVRLDNLSKNNKKFGKDNHNFGVKWWKEAKKEVVCQYQLKRI